MNLDFTTIFEGTLGLVYGIFVIVFGVFCIIGMWKLFTKAGRAGWLSLIPIVNFYVLFQIAFGCAKQFWIVLAASVLAIVTLAVGVALGGVGAVICMLLFLAFIAVAIVIDVIMALALAKAFGKESIGFGVGLVLLAPVFYLILGFGSAQYIGAKGVKA
ncbi:MAG: DUF5684 domain-containing protein [Ruthenibacterium sp.]